MAASKKPRKWHVDRALHSVRAMMGVINTLTMAELHAALELESASRRRKQIMRRLIGRAARLNELTFTKSLMEKYNASI